MEKKKQAAILLIIAAVLLIGIGISRNSSKEENQNVQSSESVTVTDSN